MAAAATRVGQIVLVAVCVAAATFTAVLVSRALINDTNCDDTPRPRRTSHAACAAQRPSEILWLIGAGGGLVVGLGVIRVRTRPRSSGTGRR